MSKSKRKKKRSKSGKNRTPISGHTRVRKQLIPPLAKLGDKLSFSSWLNDRLPEMLWAALIRAGTDQENAISEFRRILAVIGEHDERGEFSDITLTGLSKINAPLREEFLRHVVRNPGTAEALTPLRFFENLPARETWLRLLPDVAPDVELLMAAVGQNLWHQSQEATDCRWVRLMGRLLSGKLRVPEFMAKEWFGYPNEGDQRTVRPSIRAAEISENSLSPPDLTWPKAFWEEAWHNTPCFILGNPERQGDPPSVSVTRHRISEVLDALEEHWNKTHVTTAIDPKHDAIFGLAFYSVRVLNEMIGIGVGTGVLGRLGLRTLLEVRISLRFLIEKDEETLWKKWRAYGAGQAKLNALKFDHDLDAPKHIDLESIERIAGEDLWEEFVSIDLGSWSDLDLRKLSERTGLKDLYDEYYSWTSGYSHGIWGPVREACFQTCGNPLHRLHRYPDSRSLPDTVEEAADLADAILAEVDGAYPKFAMRLMS